MKHNRFICQMLHEYIAYFNQYERGTRFGGGVFVLEEPGRSPRTRDLTGGRLPEGCYMSLALSADAQLQSSCGTAETLRTLIPLAVAAE
jgi:hypothetical protein